MTGYRAALPRPRGRLSLLVSPTLGVLLAVSVLAIAPLCLWLFLWSRVTAVTCDVRPTAPGFASLVCDVSARSIVLASTRHVEVDGVFGIRPAGAWDRTRGDMWVEAVTKDGAPVELTPPFNGSKGAQMELARRLEVAVGRGATERVTATFGSTTGVLFVPILCAVGAAIIAWIAFASRRVVVVRDGFSARIKIGIRRSEKPILLDLGTLAGFRVVDPPPRPTAPVRGKRRELPETRARIDALGTDGSASPLLYVDLRRAERVRRELEAFLL